MCLNSIGIRYRKLLHHGVGIPKAIQDTDTNSPLWSGWRRYRRQEATPPWCLKSNWSEHGQQWTQNIKYLNGFPLFFELHIFLLRSKIIGSKHRQQWTQNIKFLNGFPLVFRAVVYLSFEKQNYWKASHYGFRLKIRSITLPTFLLFTSWYNR